MIEKILSLISKLLELFGFLKSLLYKSPQEIEDKAKENLRKEIDDFKKTGRPPK